MTKYAVTSSPMPIIAPHAVTLLSGNYSPLDTFSRPIKWSLELKYAWLHLAKLHLS